MDTNGNLFIGGVNLSTGQIWCIRSTNAKNGAVTPSFDQSTAVNLGGDISINELINPIGLVGQVFTAVDRSGTGTNNNVYMMASVQPTGFSGSDVMFVRSTNGGQTFSTPKRVNDDPVNHSKWHWFGTLSVAPNGRIDSIWLDTRNAANNTDSQLFYSYSTNAGNAWSPNIAVSNSFNPFLGYPSQNKMGDYMTIVSDNTGGDVAYTATFNLEEDIYYVRVAPPIGPTPTPAVSISGTLLYCSNPVPGPVPNVTLDLTGTATASTITDGAGNYILSSLVSGGSYAVTPSKAPLTPGTAGINTVDALATQRHFLNFGTPLSGCPLAAADVNADIRIDTIDAIAIQRFFLGLPTGNGNVGKYRFNPPSRGYLGMVNDQTGQDYDTLVFGDVVSGFVHRGNDK